MKFGNGSAFLHEISAFVGNSLWNYAHIASSGKLLSMKKVVLFYVCTMVYCFASAQGGPTITDTRPVAKSPQIVVADKSRVMDYFQNQQFDEAISYLATAIDEDSANAGVLGYLGYAYYMTDRGTAAERCYKRILGLDSGSVSALYYLETIVGRDDPDQALGYVVRLTSLQPSKAAWWRTKGELLRRLRQSDSAYAAFMTAYGLAPEETKNVTALAEMLIERKNFTAADSILDIALGRDSLSFPVIKTRMRSAYSAKDFAAVTPLGERVMRLNLPDVNVQSWLALSYYNLKQYPDCIRACEFLTDAGYDVEAVLYYESRALSKLARYDESNELLQICLKKAIEPTAEWYYHDRADNFEGKHQYKAALSHYDTAYYMFHSPLMLYNAGRVAETGLKDISLARKYYRRYLTTGRPVDAEERKAYDYVRRRWGTGK